MQKKYKIPVILYETEEEALPYIEVEEGDDMPPVLFIQEYKHTGETEPADDGSEQSIVDMHIHMYADMQFLEKKLSADRYDEVRVAMGLQPLKKARQEGQKVLDRVFANANTKAGEIEAEKNKAKEEVARRLNEKLTEKFFSAAAESKDNPNSDK
jgi:hypothetical protein